MVWIVAIALAGLGAWAATGLKLNVSAEGLVPTDSPLRATYEDVKATFGSDYVVGVYIEDPNLFTVAKLRTLSGLAAKLAQIPSVERSESLLRSTTLTAPAGPRHRPDSQSAAGDTRGTGDGESAGAPQSAAEGNSDFPRRPGHIVDALPQARNGPTGRF